MVKPLVILTVSAALLGGCSTVRDSRVNPFNWFGGATAQPVAVQNDGTAANPLIPERRRNVLFGRAPAETPYLGRPIARISELLVERRAGGAIVRVSGVADRVGPFDVRLTPVADAPGTLSYSLDALQTAGPRNTADWARTVTAAVWLTDQELAGIQTIRVVGRDNQMVTSR